MTTNDPTEPAELNETQPADAENADAQSEPTPEAPPQRILIGSQRDPAAYRARQSRDWEPLPEKDEGDSAQGEPPAPAEPPPPAEPPSPAEPPPPADVAEKPPQEVAPQQESPPEPPREPDLDEAHVTAELDAAEPPSGKPFPVPNLREQLPSDLEDEFNKALGDVSLDELMAGDDSLANQAVLEEESRHTGRVVAVRCDDVFVELGSREQGCVPVKQFEEPPEPGTTLEVVVQRFNLEDGLYELSIPGTAVTIDDWADIKEGMLLEARITGHNAGGLECEVQHLRGFIPISQVALYRVDDLAQFVDQKFNCLVTEANPQRRNLVLSRRAVLEREKQEAREKLLASLQPGQIHEGVVRKLMDFGAFVDIGEMDGLLHVSQLAWHRVNHPSEVLSEGQTIKVKIEKIDRATGKMSLAYRDMLENPWEKAAQKYPANSVFEGTVTKLMEFGAFVQLEQGIEGLVHISELSHKRVWRASDVVHEGEKVEVMVLSVDPEAQRMSLSIQKATPEPEPTKKEEDSETAPLPSKPAKRKIPDRPLKGGLGKSSGGEPFGLKW